MIGVVSFWDSTRGYGFICPNGGGPSIYAEAAVFNAARVRPEVGVAVCFTAAPAADGRARVHSIEEN